MTATASTDAIIIDTSNDDSEIDSAVIWLHGLGADGNDFAPIVPQLQLPQDMNTRFIFPHAPVMPVTINQGYRMRAWYDIRSLSIVDGEDEQGITRSSRWLAQQCDMLIEQGIKPHRIILAGFSQGGAIALHCGCRYQHTLGGIMALSTYMPLPERLESERSENISTVPIFMAHGRLDDVISIDHARRSRDRLLAHDIKLSWHEYDMPHSVCEQEIVDIKQWLINALEV